MITLPADYDLKLLNSAGNQVAISQNGTTTNESISYTAAAGVYYAQVYGYSGANNATSCYTLKVALGTATRQVESIGKAGLVTIYPNPVRNELKVNTGNNTEAVSVNITDMFGRQLQSKTISGAASLNTSSMPSGIYMITIVDKKGKVIKQDKLVKE